MTKIKICGLKRPVDIDYANRVKPDYIGFIFAKKSHRYVEPETAAALSARLDPAITPVGVFVNSPVEEVAALLSAGTIRVAQLHGQEDEDYIKALRALIDAPIIKAFSVETGQDIAAACRSTADYLLLDHGSGGTGEAFDWSILEDLGRPYFLAGGLDPDNVSTALKLARPFAVDVSSGVETDKLKDPARMEAFVRAVRESEENR
jgi:phosphoribosylanthranilate isomerase